MMSLIRLRLPVSHCLYTVKLKNLFFCQQVRKTFLHRKNTVGILKQNIFSVEYNFQQMERVDFSIKNISCLLQIDKFF
jgi:hypothetical protein